MAVKSRKVAAKTKQAKKSPGGKPKAGKPRPIKDKAAREEFEVVPNLLSPQVEKHLIKVKDFVENSTHITETELAQGINEYSKQAAVFALEAVKAGASALVYAWACGKLLNTAKARFGRGDFGKWRTENLLSDSLSERTTTRYMLLAKQCGDVKSLLEWSPSLRQAYIACGILPEPERMPGEEGEDASPKTQALLSSLSGLQKNLRLFTDSGEKLGKADLNQLKLMRDELNRFFEQVIPSGK